MQSPIRVLPISIEVAGAPNIAKKRRSPSIGRIATSDFEDIDEASPPRKKRGRPRKQQPAAVARAHSSSAGEGSAETIELVSRTSPVKVIRDSQEDVDVDGIGGDKPDTTGDGFPQGLKDVMREIFVGNSMEKDGGL